MKQSYSFTKEVVLPRQVADSHVETAMKEHQGNRHVNRVAKFVEKKSNSSSIERAEGEGWTKDPKMNRLVQGSEKTVSDATAPESSSNFYYPDKGMDEIDYEDQVDDDDIDQDDAADKYVVRLFNL